MLEFILASGNQHKAEEFQELFKTTLFIKPAAHSLNPDESGKTYAENALIKAKAYYEEFKLASLADDSGLTIPALPDILGVQSARFRDDLPDCKAKCEAILNLLAEVEAREAFFSCTLWFYLNPSEIYFFEGRVQGSIGFGYKGSHGFGYDPIFIPTRKENDGASLAELPEWKNIHSHRARASEVALHFFKNFKN